MRGDLNLSIGEVNSPLAASTPRARRNRGVSQGTHGQIAAAYRLRREMSSSVGNRWEYESLFRELSLRNIYLPSRLDENVSNANPLLVVESISSMADTAQAAAATQNDPWAILESMMGTIDGPTDWSSDLDHYLYGTPKRNEPQ